MKNIQRYRAMGSLCRQQVAHDPAQSWHQNWQLLAQAEYWEHLAEVEMSSRFKECNGNRSSDLVKSGTTPGANDTR